MPIPSSPASARTPSAPPGRTNGFEDAIRRAQNDIGGYRLSAEVKNGRRCPAPISGLTSTSSGDTDAGSTVGAENPRGQDDSTARHEPSSCPSTRSTNGHEALADVRRPAERAQRCGDRENKSRCWCSTLAPPRRGQQNPQVRGGCNRPDAGSYDLYTWFDTEFLLHGNPRRSRTSPAVPVSDGPSTTPAGRLSQLKIDQARGNGPEAGDARDWCLRFTTNLDVAAQAAIRDGLRPT